MANEHETIDRILTDLNTRYSISLSCRSMPSLTWRIDHELASESDYPALCVYVQLFEEEFSKYTTAFINKTKLKSVVFAKDVKSNAQLRSAVPDYKKEVLIYDFLRGDAHPNYQRHVVHHEFYHMIEEQMFGHAYYKDPNWVQLNADAFEYGSGGAQSRGGDMFGLTHPQPGFVNPYSMTAAEEDKAEVYACLFSKPEATKMLEWAESDPILASKIDYMKESLTRLDSSMDDTYWGKLVKEEGGAGVAPPAAPFLLP